ncbi:MAG: LamG-like jellyroll fold domain-containing protein [Candidatus Brennerbacteria bacterium]
MKNKRSGQSLVEVVIGLAIGAILMGTAAFAVTTMLRTNLTSEKSQFASQFAQSLSDNVRSYVVSNWESFYGLTKATSTHYFLNASGTTFFTVQGEEGLLDGDVPDGLVGHWKFDEVETTTSTTTYDATGSGSHGTLTTGPTRASSTCKVANCLNFDGVNDYVDVPEATSTLDVTSILTFSAWIYPTSSSSYKPILAKIPVAYGSGYEFANSSGNFRTTLRTGSGNCDFTNGALTLNTWQHVASTYDGTTTRHYLNGALASSSAACTYGATANDNDLYIGGRASDTSRFAGMIDDVRVYNRALSSDEARQLYNSGIYERFFTIENVCRTNDASSTIASRAPCSGTVEDGSTQWITNYVQWVTGGGTSEVKLSAIVARWQNAVFHQTDWSGGASDEGAVAAPTGKFASSTNASTTGGAIQIQNLSQ